MREIYFDNAATTRCFPEILDLMTDIMLKDYGNPSSLHRKGVEAERYYIKAREQVAKTLKVKPKEIYFTSGGTESDNMALIGAALQNVRRGKHIIASGIEHAAVSRTLGFLKDSGYEISFIPVDEKGRVYIEKLSEAIRKDTILVSIMYVNNEIGAIQPIKEIGRIIKERNPDTLFHTDAVQAYGKYNIRPSQEGIDLLSISGHKFHSPKGIGALYVSEKVSNSRIKAILYGGGQQDDLRPGTHNVPGMAALGMAAEMMYGVYAKKVRGIYELKDRLISALEKMPSVFVHSQKGLEGAPQIVSASFEGVKAEVMLHALEEKGIYVGSGSACSTNHPGISDTLKGIGLPPRLLDSNIRFSFSVFNEIEEVDECIMAIEEILPMLRRFTKR